MRKTGFLFFAMVALGFSGVSYATTLTFEDGPGTAAPVNQAYGDNVTASPDLNGYHYADLANPTPDVTLTYGATTDWVKIPGIVPDGVSFPDGDQSIGSTWTYTFTAAPGTQVTLNSFQYEYVGGETPPAIHYAVAGGNMAVSGDFADNATDAARGNIDLGGVAGQTLTLTLTETSGTNAPGIGIDNINFTEVPEPATISIVGLIGSGLLLGRRRR